MIKLKEIIIENVKGIKDKKVLEVNLVPNKVTILVAPNGFGKSSVATAFKSLKPKEGLVLEKKDRVNGNDTNPPYLELKFEESNYSHKEIKNKFDIKVINSPLKAKSAGKYGGANITIPNIDLISNIPNKKLELKYKLKKNGKIFEIDSKILIDVKHFFNNLDFFRYLSNIDKKKLEGKKVNEELNKFKEYVNRLSGKPDIVKDQIFKKYNCDFEKIHNQVDEIINKIKDYFDVDDKNLYLCTYQIINIVKEENLKEIYKYEEYKNQKKGYDDLLSSFNTRDDDIKTKESKKKLIVEFPNANLISNGQRDSLTFTIELEKIKNNIRKNKKPMILIIDEVFDYLDNANLIAVQYYISKFVNYCKKNDRELYPIILTHLDPCLLSNYVFKKPQIVYLNKTKQEEDRFFDFIKIRDDKDVKDVLSKYFMHYRNDKKDISDIINKKKFSKDMGKNWKFYDMLKQELENYIGDKEYQPFGVALGLRIITEEYLYKKIDEEKKENFLNEKGTNKKIDFCIENNVEVSEIFGMLTILYNDFLHINENKINTEQKLINFKQKLLDKLNHTVIKKIASDIWYEYIKPNKPIKTV